MIQVGDKITWLGFWGTGANHGLTSFEGEVLTQPSKEGFFEALGNVKGIEAKYKFVLCSDDKSIKKVVVNEKKPSIICDSGYEVRIEYYTADRYRFMNNDVIGDNLEIVIQDTQVRFTCENAVEARSLFEILRKKIIVDSDDSFMRFHVLALVDYTIYDTHDEHILAKYTIILDRKSHITREQAEEILLKNYPKHKHKKGGKL